MKSLQESGLHHTGFIVQDVDEAVDIFKNTYGISAEEPYDFYPSKAWSYGRPVTDYCLRIAMIPMENGSQIEIIQPVSGEGVHKHFIENGKQGLHHICFAVDDYKYWRDYFFRRGYPIIFESETEDKIHGYRRCFYANCEGINMIYEIKENPYFRE